MPRANFDLSNAKALIKADSDKSAKKVLNRSKLREKACRRPLDDFTPGKYDVLLQRSRAAYHHIGNRRFRVIVENHAASFAVLSTKAQRSRMIQQIVEIITNAKGKFVEKNMDEQWVEVGLVKRKEKVGHALRAAVNATKLKGHQRTIYDVLGENPFSYPSGSMQASTSVVHDAYEESILERPCRKLSSSCADNKRFGVSSAIVNKQRPICVPRTDCMMNHRGEGESNEEEKPDMLPEAFSPDMRLVSSILPLMIPSNNDIDVDDVFEMYEEVEMTLHLDDFLNQPKELLLDIDSVFPANPIPAC